MKTGVSSELTRHTQLHKTTHLQRLVLLDTGKVHRRTSFIQLVTNGNCFYLRQQFIFHRLSYKVTKGNKERTVLYPLVRVRNLTPVTNNVHATNHLTNGEEANNLSGSDTSKGKLLGAGVADTGEDARGRGEVLEGGGVVDEGLEVGLESGHVARHLLVELGVIAIRADLRRSHVLATENQLAELKANLGVVESRGDQSWIEVSCAPL